MSAWLWAAMPWIKALHIFAVIAWMAGMLYLPRLYVYHAGVVAGSETAATFAVMERRLLRGIMNPSMVLVWMLGALLAGTPGLVDWGQGWIWVKLAGVAALTVLHHLMARWGKDFAAGANRHGAGFYRIVNEVPAVLLLVILAMVVVRPF
ncbi:MAG: protoporphyrinogen oxidase HemJ [Alphaproteobacteria bacterium]|nr:protoporphyrinogen oxidase HemJ [Alphaproteobacteria bacterium]